MKRYLKALVGFLILFSSPVFSGEVTDKEWNDTHLIVKGNWWWKEYD
jgi:hypothetical protein